MQQGGGSSVARYVSLPAATWSQPGAARKSFITINDVAVPAVPALCGLLCLIGLPMWAVSMLRVRATVGSIFTDLGLAAASLDSVKASVLAAVIVLAVLLACVATANAWLEHANSKAGSQRTGLSLSDCAARTRQLNCANWVMLLLLALALAGTVTWLSNMSTALSALEGGGGGFGPGLQQRQQWPQKQQQQDGAGGSEVGVALAARVALPGAPAAVRTCPPGCVDLGVVAELLGLPWPCFCSLGMLGGLIEQLHGVVRDLWVALVGALLMFCAGSWMFGYWAAQGAHVARDLDELLTGGSGSRSGLVGA